MIEPLNLAKAFVSVCYYDNIDNFIISGVTKIEEIFCEKRNASLRWVSNPGAFDCRSNALSSELLRFHTTFLTESIYASCGYGQTRNYFLIFPSHFSRLC